MTEEINVPGKTNSVVHPNFESKVDAKTPEWVKDAVFYQIFPDRFAKSGAVPKPANLEGWEKAPTTAGYKGGDLLGIAEQIAYLADLGINAIYLNPIFASAANHRYHTHDYFQIDPILGGNAALRKLLDVAHSNGIRVVLDGVFNHASRGFYQFNHALENGVHSPYLDWFHFGEFPVNAYGPGKPNYQAWWDLPALPKFNTKTQAVREFLWDVGRYWLEFGIDGWRLDVPNEIDDDEFWREFRRQVKKVNPQAYICGEIWVDAQRWLQGDQFDSVMNYLFTRACLGFFSHEIDQQIIESGYGHINFGMRAPEFGKTIQDLLKLYPEEITRAQLNLLDSHDTARFLSITKKDEAALRMATLFQMSYPGAPCIYYGDEVGMEGGRDPDCRRAFIWDKNCWNGKLRDFFKRAIEMRHDHVALRRGTFDQFYAEGGLYVFGRSCDDERLIVALNTDMQAIELPTLPTGEYLPKNSPAILLEVLNTGSDERRAWQISNNGTLENFKLAPRTGVVFEVVKLVS